MKLPLLYLLPLHPIFSLGREELSEINHLKAAPMGLALSGLKSRWSRP